MVLRGKSKNQKSFKKLILTNDQEFHQWSKAKGFRHNPKKMTYNMVLVHVEPIIPLNNPIKR